MYVHSPVQITHTHNWQINPYVIYVHLSFVYVHICMLITHTHIYNWHINLYVIYVHLSFVNVHIAVTITNTNITSIVLYIS